MRSINFLLTYLLTDWPNDTPFMPCPTVLSSIQSILVANDSGANIGTRPIKFWAMNFELHQSGHGSWSCLKELWSIWLNFWDTNSCQKWSECGSGKWVESSTKINVLCEGWTTVILPSLCDTIQSNYGIACGATRHKTTLLRASVR